MAVVPLYVATAFLNTFLFATGKIDKITLMILNAVIFFFSSLNLCVNGVLTKYFQPIKMMKLACILTALFAGPILWVCTKESVILICFAELLLLSLMNLFIAPSLAFMSSLFPVEVRYRGTAIPYCIGMAFLGGTAPYICAQLVNLTSFQEAPALYLLAVCLTAWWGVCKAENLVEKRKQKALSRG